jgi:hypothetical protein
VTSQYSVIRDGIHLPSTPVQHRNEEYNEGGFETLRDMQERHFWYRGRHRVLVLLGVGVTAILWYGVLLQEHINTLVLNYVGSRLESSGAVVRIAMNAFPAALFLLLRKRFQLSKAQRIFWTWMSLGAIMLVALLYISPSSTAVDRVGLYWLPLQIFVWSRVPDAMGRSGGANARWVHAVLATVQSCTLSGCFLQPMPEVGYHISFFPGFGFGNKVLGHNDTVQFRKLNSKLKLL